MSSSEARQRRTKRAKLLRPGTKSTAVKTFLDLRSIFLGKRTADCTLSPSYSSYSRHESRPRPLYPARSAWRRVCFGPFGASVSFALSATLPRPFPPRRAEVSQHSCFPKFHLFLSPPYFPPSGPAAGSSNGLHPKSRFLAAGFLARMKGPRPIHVRVDSNHLLHQHWIADENTPHPVF